jgi:hypothetical protein
MLKGVKPYSTGAGGVFGFWIFLPSLCLSNVPK